jgi:hypothetical protein
MRLERLVCFLKGNFFDAIEGTLNGFMGSPYNGEKKVVTNMNCRYASRSWPEVGP